MVNSGVASGRRRLTVEDRREQLVDVGVGLIATRSWDDLTMSEIAAEAGVSKPLLYHYFSTKTELYVASVAAAADQLRRATAPDPSVPPRDRGRRSLVAHMDWVEQNELGYRAILQGGASANPDVAAIVERSRAEVVERVARDIAPGAVPPALRIALRGWIGFLEGASLDWLLTKDLPKPDLVSLLEAALAGAIALAGGGFTAAPRRG